MKLSFSIRNWEGIRWEEFCGVASATGMAGIELYDIKGEMFTGKTSVTNPGLSAAARRELAKAGLTIPCVCAVHDFTDPDFQEELADCIETAVNLGVENVGVRTDNPDMDACVNIMRELIEMVNGNPVRLLVETTGAFALIMH